MRWNSPSPTSSHPGLPIREAHWPRREITPFSFAQSITVKLRALSEAQSFVVKPVHGADFDYEQVAAFQKKTAELRRQVAHAGEELTRTEGLLTHMKAAVLLAPGADAELIVRLDGFGAALTNLKTQLVGDAVRAGLDEATSPSIAGRAYNAANNWNNTRPATGTQQTDYAIAERDFADFKGELERLLKVDLTEIEAALLEAGAPSWR